MSIEKHEFAKFHERFFDYFKDLRSSVHSLFVGHLSVFVLLSTLIYFFFLFNPSFTEQQFTTFLLWSISFRNGSWPVGLVLFLLVAFYVFLLGGSLLLAYRLNGLKGFSTEKPLIGSGIYWTIFLMLFPIIGFFASMGLLLWFNNNFNRFSNWKQELESFEAETGFFRQPDSADSEEENEVSDFNQNQDAYESEQVAEEHTTTTKVRTGHEIMVVSITGNRMPKGLNQDEQIEWLKKEKEILRLINDIQQVDN